MKFGTFLITILLLQSDVFAADFACTPGALSRNIEYIKKFIKSADSDVCKLPPVGAEKKIYISAKDSLTTVEHNYLIRRTKPKKIDIFLGINFYSDDAAGNREELDKLNNKWQGIASACLKKTHGKIFTANGEEIQIKLQDNTLNQGMSQSIIKIKDSGRADSSNWTEDMQFDCSVVFHELLHLMGLADEYKESSVGIKIDPDSHQHTHVETGADKAAYDCRQYYEKNSIMADNSKTWNSAFANHAVKIVPCECTNPTDCKSYEESAQEWLKPENLTPNELTEEFLERKRRLRLPAKCPKGYRLSKNSQGTIIQGINREDYESSLPFSINKGKITPNAHKFIDLKQNATMLLEPRHLNAILYPGCMAKNEKYYQNSANSYRTSQSNGGEGCMDFSWPLP